MHQKTTDSAVENQIKSRRRAREEKKSIYKTQDTKILSYRDNQNGFGQTLPPNTVPNFSA
jgi:hypothetical protein